MINTNILVPDYYILLVQALVMFIYKTCQFRKLKKMRPLWLIEGLAFLNTNITFSQMKDKTQFLRHSRGETLVPTAMLVFVAAPALDEVYTCHTIPFPF